MERLTSALQGPKLLVKRDDQTGLAFGGNKTRKLEFLLAEAIANGAKTLITAGAVQSNHCRQTAAAAIKGNLDCILVLGGDPPANPSGNFLMDLIFNAEIVWAKPAERDHALQHTFERARETGRKPYLVPYGGSNPTGAAAYAYALKEMLDQHMTPDWIVFPSSSGGTHAGLVTGARMFGFAGQILGISIDEPQIFLQEKVAKLASDVAKHLGLEHTFAADDIIVNADYLGDGYGVMGELEREAILTFARHEGLLLDPVYTGRAAAGLLDLIRKGFFDPGQVVLFWHTGGTPALFADRYKGLIKRSD
jgi:D-cysteine desulfhydrase family pyridoxal phosphate-dependent enzyme